MTGESIMPFSKMPFRWIKDCDFAMTSTPRKNLIIRITTSRHSPSRLNYRLQGLDAGGEFRVAPLDLKLSPNFLVKLSEKMSGWLKVEVVEGDSIICSKTKPVSLLARNEWCGLVSLPEILAAFILPNDAAAMTILNRAAELLREHTGSLRFQRVSGQKPQARLGTGCHHLQSGGQA